MADWQQLLQSIFIGLIVSYLLAKLISIVVSFKEDNFSITRTGYEKIDRSGPGTGSLELQKSDSVMAELGSIRDESDDDVDDDDDWEGVECTELDDAFNAATTFVAAAAASNRLWQKIPTEVQLQLYGLYKIATEGPCTAPQPSALRMTARAKWKMDAIHTFAREGELDNLIKCIESGVSVHLQDSEGRTPLHWAVDRGHLKITEELLRKKADVNAKDNEGQTPLHYAVVCDRKDVAEFLVKQNADKDTKDNDGKSPVDVCELD